jgi:hypothetical protein
LGTEVLGVPPVAGVKSTGVTAGAGPVARRLSEHGVDVAEAVDNGDVSTALYVRCCFAIAVAVVAGGLAATPDLVRGHWLAAAISGCSFGIILGGAVRSSSLSVTSDGLSRVRGLKYGWNAAWVDVRVVRTRNRRFAVLDQLRVHTGRPTGALSTTKTVTRRGRRGFGRDRHVFIRMYDQHWETGPIGVALSTTDAPAKAPAD